MNTVIENMITRRSCRNFKPDMIPESVLTQIIEAGSYAASGMNRQSPIIIAVTNKELRDSLSQMNARIMNKDSSFDPFYGAPVILIVLALTECPCHLYDGSLVIGNLMLAAHSLNIGSCWIHRAKEEFLSPEGKDILKKFGLSGEYEGIGHCALGYWNESLPPPPARKSNYTYFIK